MKRTSMVMGAFVFALASAFAVSTLHAATCTGSDPCNACKNCHYCRYCAKQGGKCGFASDEQL